MSSGIFWASFLSNRDEVWASYSPGELKQRLAEFVNYYNNHRYHESIQNIIPADVYFGRDKQILKKRRMMKKKTMIY